MAEKPEKKDKKDKATAANEVVPVVAVPVEKKDKKDKATAASEAPVAAVPVEKKNTPPRPKLPNWQKRISPGCRGARRRPFRRPPTSSAASPGPRASLDWHGLNDCETLR